MRGIRFCKGAHDVVCITFVWPATLVAPVTLYLAVKNLMRLSGGVRHSYNMT